MSKVTLTDVYTLRNEASALATINENSDLLTAAIDNTLSRNGQVPNEMNTLLDMNNNRIINISAPQSGTEPVRLADLYAINNHIPLVINVDVNTNFEVYVSKAEALTKFIDAAVTVVFLSGYYVNGDGGGAQYRRAATEPLHDGKWQSSDGAWWEIVCGDRVSVLQFGAKADHVVNTAGVQTVAGTDNIPFFESTAEYCRTNGKTLHIPGGKYRLASTWGIDWSTDQPVTYWYDFRFRIEGDGRRATYLFFDAGAAVDGISINGTGSGVSNPTLPHTSQEILVGMSLIKPDREGVGLSLFDHFHCQVRDIGLLQWDYGFQLIDVHESTFSEFVCIFNNQGGLIQKSDDTQPNMITFEGSTISNNWNYGIEAVDVVEFHMINCEISNNGYYGTDETIKWGIRLAFDAIPIEGVASALFSSCRFEGNVGTTHADVYYVNGVRDAAVTFVGCDFLRDGGAFGLARRQLNCIRVQTTGLLTHKINIIGCGFIGFNGYTGDALWPYVALVDATQNITVFESGSHFHEPLETPNFGSLGLHRTREFENSSWAIMSDAVGTIGFSANVASCTKNSTGNFSVVFRKPLALSSYHISFNIITALIRHWAITAIADTGFTVQFWDNAGVVQDNQFSFAVVGGVK